MNREHADVFTEPDVDCDTLANLGPLRAMAGVFVGERGVDTHPVSGGEAVTNYRERYELHAIDPQTNGPQLLYGLRYHVVIRLSEDLGTFHDQIGYWLWEPAAETVVQTVAIPRGQVALASGHASADATSFTLRAERGTTGFGICSNPFLETAFTTLSYEITVTTYPDESWSYEQNTVMSVLGRDEPTHHTDSNTMFRVEEPSPNLLISLDIRSR